MFDFGDVNPDLVWTMQSALELINKMVPSLWTAGYTVALTGGVLFHGKSTKDVDIIIYPLKCKGSNNFVPAKKILGERCNLSFTELVDHYGHDGDTKWVEKWQTADGRRIDFFFMDGFVPKAEPVAPFVGTVSWI